MDDASPSARAAVPPPLMLINGEWLRAADGKEIDVFNPATGRKIATIAAGAKQDADLAVEAARQSFSNRVWRKLGSNERANIMFRAASLLEAHAEALAALETLDNGMPLAAARVRVQAAADSFRYYGGWCTKIHGITSTINNAMGQFHGYTLREPIGVAALIVPWNMPLILAANKVAAALAAGCSVILKPAEETSLTALRLGELLLQAGVPAGVVNVVTGLGHIVGAALTAHPDVAKVSFTGSTEVGRQIVAAAQGNLKRVALELGGKSPVIVFDDADIDAAAAGAARGIFANSGQMCVAGSRLFVQRKSYDRMLEGVCERAAALQLGDGFDPKSELGPIISSKQLQRVVALVDAGISDGGEVMAGGARMDRPGYFMQPTVLSGLKPETRAMREEIFGPVIAATPFDDEDEAIALANDTEYGLAAAVWSQDSRRVRRVAHELDAGTVWMNCQLVLDRTMPFGGFKQSGWGRENGWEGIESFLQTKALVEPL